MTSARSAQPFAPNAGGLGEGGSAQAGDGGGSGALLFARYAYPPNLLGYCGPDDHRAFFEYGTEGVVDPGLLEMARAFDGAWPYLELIASANGIRDPLDRTVVEAYWVGNALLDRVDMASMGRSVEDRFRRSVGDGWESLAGAVLSGAVPHHSFHLLLVTPWVGLMRGGMSDHPLQVLDRCRIRWGRVLKVVDGVATVSATRLAWDGRTLCLGPPEVEMATVKADGRGFVPDLVPGEWVSLHWDWVCDRLTHIEVHSLRRYTIRHLGMANANWRRPAPL